jgi:hypothetical protein
MLRYKLRTLLILLAILPPLLWIGWTTYEAWRAEQRRRKALAEQIDWLIWTELQAAPLITGEVEVQATNEPPSTPMQPGEVDVRKLMWPK